MQNYLKPCFVLIGVYQFLLVFIDVPLLAFPSSVQVLGRSPKLKAPCAGAHSRSSGPSADRTRTVRDRALRQ